MPSKNELLLPPEVAEAFPDLTLGQFRLLGYCAYRGGYPLNPWTVTLYDGHFDIPKNRTEADRKVLEQKGLLVGGEILPRDYFRIVVPVMKHFPEWARAYGEFSRFRSETSAYLWAVAECIAAGNLSQARKLRFPAKDGVWQYFIDLLYADGYGDKVLSILPQKETEQFLAFFLQDKFENGQLDESTLGTVLASANNWFPRSVDIPGRADAYAYYLTGALPEDSPVRSFWTEGVRATDQLLKGDLSGSLETFLKARSLTPPGCDGTFPDRLMTWFYALCLVRQIRKYQSPRAERALDALRLSSGFRYDPMHAATQTLLTHMDESEKNCLGLVAGELRKHLERDRSVLGRDMALAVLRYFKADDERISALGLDPSAVPCIPVFRNETAELCPTVSAEKQHLRDLFGGPGVLSAIPRKEAWEMALNDLSATVASSKEEDAFEKRIIYFVDDKWITAVIEQRRRSGETEWSGDKLLSRSQLVKGGYDSMDLLDHKVARELGNKVVDRPDTEVVLPALAGSGRLFTGQFYRPPYRPLPVEMETPFVAFSGKDGAIAVSSNVRRRQDGTVPEVSILRNGGKYTCIRTNPVQRDILTRLLAVGRFPVSALPVIRHTIDSLEGILEVRSDLPAMAVIPTVRGSARICIRLTPLPDGDGYGIDLSAAPLEEIDLRCEPGRGLEDVYDATGGDARGVDVIGEPSFREAVDVVVFAQGDIVPPFVLRGRERDGMKGSDVFPPLRGDERDSARGVFAGGDGDGFACIGGGGEGDGLCLAVIAGPSADGGGGGDIVARRDGDAHRGVVVMRHEEQSVEGADVAARAGGERCAEGFRAGEALAGVDDGDGEGDGMRLVVVDEIAHGCQIERGFKGLRCRGGRDADDADARVVRIVKIVDEGEASRQVQF